MRVWGEHILLVFWGVVPSTQLSTIAHINLVRQIMRRAEWRWRWTKRWIWRWSQELEPGACAGVKCTEWHDAADYSREPKEREAGFDIRSLI